MPVPEVQTPPTLERESAARQKGPRWAWAVRLGLVILGLGAWFYTQSLIGARPLPVISADIPPIGDGFMAALAPLHDYLFTHATAANALLVVSSFFIDVLALFILIRAIIGPTLRPFLGLLLLFALRQLCQATTALPAPPGIIWHNPGIPSLLVTYGVANDFFFSGHTALAVYGVVELTRFRKWLWPFAVAIALFEAATVLTLRAHWTMDVFTGAVTALWIAMIAAQLAPRVDRAIARLTTRS